MQFLYRLRQISRSNITLKHLSLMLGVLAMGLPIANTHAQITGGQNIFEHLSMSPGARITALGGAQIAVSDSDLALALYHPAALNQSMSGKLSFQHQFHLAGISNGAASYAYHVPKLLTTFQTGIQYLSYGEIPQADETGVKSGTIQTGEWAWTLGAGRKLTPKISLGLNMRLAGANFAEYKSTALVADASAMYADTASRTTIALVLKNRGAQLSTFNGTREDLPYDLQLGFSKRLRYLPFRFSVIAHHLHTWDIRYNNPDDIAETTLLFGDDQDTQKGNPALDNFFRHLIFNGEFLLGKADNFAVRFGYNHLRKRELSVENLRSLAGFSGGIGLKIKRFQIDAGYAAYHLAGGGFHLGLGTDLDSFRK